MKPRQAYYILDPSVDQKQEGDEYFHKVLHTWRVIKVAGEHLDPTYAYRRPVPETQDDGWTEWSCKGGIVGKGKVEVKLRDGTCEIGAADNFNWGKLVDADLEIVAYRIVKPAPEPEYAPLTAEDVTPGSFLKPKPDYIGWIVISEIDAAGVHLHGGRTLTYAELMERKWEILRPGEDWQPCKKLK